MIGGVVVVAAARVRLLPVHRALRVHRRFVGAWRRRPRSAPTSPDAWSSSMCMTTSPCTAAMCCSDSTIGRCVSRSRRRRPSSPPRSCRLAPPRPSTGTSSRRWPRRATPLAYQQHEFERQQRLLQSGISSRAQFEQTQHALELAQSQLTAAAEPGRSVLALLGGNPRIAAR